MTFVKYKNKSALFAATAACALSLPALAQTTPLKQTTANTEITVSASLKYSVGGVVQPVTSKSIVFRVDRKVTFTVTPINTAATNVIPGTRNQVFSFLVTNTSNAALDFQITAKNIASATGVTADNIDILNLRAVAENTLVSTSRPVSSFAYSGTDEVSGLIDNIPQEASVVVHVLADTTTDFKDKDKAIVALEVAAFDPGTKGSQGPALPRSTTYTTAMETFVYDPARDASLAGITDIKNDGIVTARADYLVTSSVNYESFTRQRIWSPLVGGSLSAPVGENGPDFPGTIFRYCHFLYNNGTLAVDPNAVLTLTIPSNMEVFKGAIPADASGAPGTNLVQFKTNPTVTPTFAADGSVSSATCDFTSGSAMTTVPDPFKTYTYPNKIEPKQSAGVIYYLRIVGL